MGGVILVLAVGIAATVVADRPAARAYWQITLLATLLLMPIVSLQASVSREPFVAISNGSAGPLLWLTLATGLTLAGLWLFAAYQTDESPQDGSLLFLPAALLTPALLGAAGDLNETSALTMLGEALLVAGVAILVGLLAPSRWRPIAGGGALGVQYVILWMLGSTPVKGFEGGAVVPICAVSLLTLTALLTVLTPLAALFSRRFFQTVGDEDGPRAPRPPRQGDRVSR